MYDSGGLQVLTIPLPVEWFCRKQRSGGQRWEEFHRNGRLEWVGGWGQWI